MEKELVDEYNARGEIIGVIDKEEAHLKGNLHKTIHLWVINDKNEILLQYRCANKKLYPNTWDCSVGGHIAAGETSLDAVIRESKEELGIDIDLTKLNYIFTFKERLKYDKINSYEYADVFLLNQNVELDQLNFQKEEVSSAKYVSLKEFFKMMDDEKLLPHNTEYIMLKAILPEIEQY